MSHDSHMARAWVATQIYMEGGPCTFEEVETVLEEVPDEVILMAKNENILMFIAWFVDRSILSYRVSRGKPAEPFVSSSEAKRWSH